MSDKLVPLVLNLNVKTGNQLNENYYEIFGKLLKTMLQNMFGIQTPQIHIRGTQTQIDMLARALSMEKKYIETFYSAGLDNPGTYRVKSELDKAVADFERKTGLRWPFK